MISRFFTPIPPRVISIPFHPLTMQFQKSLSTTLLQARIPSFPSRVFMEKSTLLPFPFISLVKKPVTGLSILLTTFSIKVDFPHLGGPVIRIFVFVIKVILCPLIVSSCFRILELRSHHRKDKISHIHKIAYRVQPLPYLAYHRKKRYN